MGYIEINCTLPDKGETITPPPLLLSSVSVAMTTYICPERSCMCMCVFAFMACICGGTQHACMWANTEEHKGK